MVDIEKLKKDLLIDEGLRLKPYKCTQGKLTIGVGRNIEDIGISKDEAEYMLENDLDRIKLELNRNFSWWKRMSEPRQRALMNMCFQLGIKRLLGFKKMLAAMEKSDFVNAAFEALDSKWAKQTQPSRVNRIIEDIKNG